MVLLHDLPSLISVQDLYHQNVQLHALVRELGAQLAHLKSQFESMESNCDHYNTAIFPRASRAHIEYSMGMTPKGLLISPRTKPKLSRSSTIPNLSPSKPIKLFNGSLSAGVIEATLAPTEPPFQLYGSARSPETTIADLVCANAIEIPAVPAASRETSRGGVKPKKGVSKVASKKRSLKSPVRARRTKRTINYRI